MSSMTPAEMYKEAVRLRAVADMNAARGWENNAESCRAGADALEALADVIEYAEQLSDAPEHPLEAFHRGEILRLAHGEVEL